MLSILTRVSGSLLRVNRFEVFVVTTYKFGKVSVPPAYFLNSPESKFNAAASSGTRGPAAIAAGLDVSILPLIPSQNDISDLQSYLRGPKELKSPSRRRRNELHQQYHSRMSGERVRESLYAFRQPQTKPHLASGHGYSPNTSRSVLYNEKPHSFSTPSLVRIASASPLPQRAVTPTQPSPTHRATPLHPLHDTQSSSSPGGWLRRLRKSRSATTLSSRTWNSKPRSPAPQNANKSMGTSPIESQIQTPSRMPTSDSISGSSQRATTRSIPSCDLSLSPASSLRQLSYSLEPSMSSGNTNGNVGLLRPSQDVMQYGVDCDTSHMSFNNSTMSPTSSLVEEEPRAEISSSQTPETDELFGVARHGDNVMKLNRPSKASISNALLLEDLPRLPYKQTSSYARKSWTDPAARQRAGSEPSINDLKSVSPMALRVVYVDQASSPQVSPLHRGGPLTTSSPHLQHSQVPSPSSTVSPEHQCLFNATRSPSSVFDASKYAPDPFARRLPVRPQSPANDPFISFSPPRDHDGSRVDQLPSNTTPATENTLRRSSCDQICEPPFLPGGRNDSQSEASTTASASRQEYLRPSFQSSGDSSSSPSTSTSVHMTPMDFEHAAPIQIDDMLQSALNEASTSATSTPAGFSDRTIAPTDSGTLSNSKTQTARNGSSDADKELSPPSPTSTKATHPIDSMSIRIEQFQAQQASLRGSIESSKMEIVRLREQIRAFRKEVGGECDVDSAALSNAHADKGGSDLSPSSSSLTPGQHLRLRDSLSSMDDLDRRLSDMLASHATVT